MLDRTFGLRFLLRIACSALSGRLWIRVLASRFRFLHGLRMNWAGVQVPLRFFVRPLTVGAPADVVRGVFLVSTRDIYPAAVQGLRQAARRIRVTLVTAEGFVNRLASVIRQHDTDLE